MANPFSRSPKIKVPVPQMNSQTLESLEKRYVFDVAVADTIEHIIGAHGLAPAEAVAHPHHGEGLVAAARSISSDNSGHVAASNWLETQLTSIRSQLYGTAAAPDSSAHALLDAHEKSALADLLTHASALDAHHALPSQVAFIDGSLPDYQTIIKDLPAGVTAVVIDPTRDGIAQISTYLDAHPGVGAIHLVAHGVEGNLEIGTSVLDANSIASVYKTALQSIGSHMAAGGDILIYGCNFAAGADGASVENLIAQTTGMNVAAADHIVGAASLGGSWVLDKTIGTVDVASIQAADWAHDLLTISAQDGSAQAIGTLPLLANLGGQGTTDTGAPVTFFIADANGNPLATGTNFTTAHGTVKITDPATGAYTYTANAGYSGTDSFRFVAAADDGTGTPQYAIAIESITIVPAQIVTQNDWASTLGGVALNGSVPHDVTGNPTGAALTYSLSVNAAHGSVVMNSNGTFTYTPNPGYIGADSFSWTATDPSGIETSSTSTYAISVTSPLYTNYGYWSAVQVGVPTTLPLAGHYTELTAGATVSFALDPATPLVNGTLTFNGDGTFTYTATNAAAATGSGGAADNFNIIVTDSNGYQTTINANIMGSLSGHGTPGANPDSFGVTEGYSLTSIRPSGFEINTSNSTEPLTFSYTTTPSKGTFTVNADGTYTYTPQPGPAGLGTYSFNYTVTDQYGQSANSTETVYVYAPSLGTTGAVKYAAAGAQVSVNLDAQTAHSTVDPWVVGGVDGGGAPVAAHLTYTILQQPLHGVLSKDPANPTGGYIYTPNPGFSGVDTFTYEVFDGYNHVQASDTIISPAHIFASNNLHYTAQNTAYSGVVNSISGSPSGGLAWHSTFAPAHGSVTLNPDGSYVYTPNNGFHGIDRFGYALTDSTGHAATAYVDILVPSATKPGDIAPTSVAIPDLLNHDSNVITYDVSTHFSNNNPTGSLTYFASGLPTGLTIDPNTGVISGTIDHLDSQNIINGQYTVIVVADDGGGGTTQQSFTWTVVNDPPVAQNHAYTTPYATAVNGNAATGSSDPNAGDVLSFAQLSNPAHGTVSMNADGSYTYTPNAGFAGTDTFTYQVSDGKGGTATATETITITPPNLLAVNDSYTTPFNTALTTGAAATADSFAAGSSFAATSVPQHGSVVMNTDGSYTYTPNSGFAGMDFFTYRITDPTGQVSTATEIITVTPPVLAAVNDSYTTPYNTPLSGNAATADSYAAGSTFTAISTPAHGAVVMNADGTYTYTPVSGYAGTDTFTYKITDPSGQSVTAVETITITPPAAPLAVNDAYTTPYNTALINGNAALADTYLVGSTFKATSAPSHGTLAMNADGSYIYTPAAGFAGTDSFTYQVKDPTGQVSAATETITITPPTIAAVDDNYTTPYNTALTTGNAASDDTYAPGSTFAVVSAPTHGIVAMNANGTYTYTPAAGFIGTDSFTYRITDPTGQTSTATDMIVVPNPVSVIAAANDTASTLPNTVLNSTLTPHVSDSFAGATYSFALGATTPQHGSLIFNTDGTYSYTPALNYTGTDSFSYSVTDQFGKVATATETILIQKPTLAAAHDVKLLTANTVLNSSLVPHVADTAAAPALTFSTVSLPSHGVVTLNADGTFAYTPNLNFTGIDIFTYSVTDQFGNVSTATETIVIQPPPLVAVSDVYATPFNTSLSGNAAANDTYAPGATFVAISNPAHGTVTMNADGTYTYVPNLNYTGPDSFAYVVTDIGGQQRIASETITVTPPVLTVVNDAYTTPYKTALAGTAGANDTFATGAVFAATSVPAHGTLTMNTDGTYTYTPAADFAGVDSFTYSVTDPAGQVKSATETITVTAPPISAVNDAYSTPYNTAVSGNAATADTFAAGSQFAATSAPSHGTLTMNADGTYTYTPSASFAGVDSFTYKITDPTGQVSTATETITVVAPAIAAVNDSYSTAYHTTLAGNAATGDTFVAGSTFAATSAPAHGTLSMNADGTYAYTPAADFTGTDSFTYSVTDPTGHSATATETITVSPPKIAAIDHALAAIYRTATAGNAATGDTFVPGSTFATATAPAHGSVTMNANGTYTYTPVAGFAGTDSFTYKVTDPTGQISIATEKITVALPVIAAVDHTVTVPYGTALIAGNAATGDNYAPGSTFTATSAPAHGVAVMNADGTYTDMPVARFVGTDSFTYKVTDPTGQTATATETIRVLPPAPPKAVDDHTTLVENSSISGSVAGDVTEPIPGLPVSFSVTSTTAHGTLTINPNGTFNYVPNHNFAGTDSFVYQVSDGLGGTATATMFITVTPDGSTPTFKCLTTFENYASLNLFPL